MEALKLLGKVNESIFFFNYFWMYHLFFYKHKVTNLFKLKIKGQNLMVFVKIKKKNVILGFGWRVWILKSTVFFLLAPELTAGLCFASFKAISKHSEHQFHTPKETKCGLKPFRVKSSQHRRFNHPSIPCNQRTQNAEENHARVKYQELKVVK